MARLPFVAESPILIQGSDKVLRVTFDVHYGRQLVNVRYWYDAGGRLCPDRRGVTFDAGYLPAVLQELEKLTEQLVKDGVFEYTDASDRSELPKYHPYRYLPDDHANKPAPRPGEYGYVAEQERGEEREPARARRRKRSERG